jgi:hypothetical protein
MTYANIDAVMVRLGNSLSEDPSEEIIAEGIAAAEDRIQGALKKKDITPPTSDTNLTRAANYLAVADILTSMNNTNTELPAAVNKWEKLGCDKIREYITDVLNRESGQAYTKSNNSMSWYDHRRRP